MLTSSDEAALNRDDNPADGLLVRVIPDMPPGQVPQSIA